MFHNHFLLLRGMVPKLLRVHILLRIILKVSDPGAPSNSWRRLCKRHSFELQWNIKIYGGCKVIRLQLKKQNLCRNKVMVTLSDSVVNNMNTIIIM